MIEAGENLTFAYGYTTVHSLRYESYIRISILLLITRLSSSASPLVKAKDRREKGVAILISYTLVHS